MIVSPFWPATSSVQSQVSGNSLRAFSRLNTGPPDWLRGQRETPKERNMKEEIGERGDIYLYIYTERKRESEKETERNRDRQRV